MQEKSFRLCYFSECHQAEERAQLGRLLPPVDKPPPFRIGTVTKTGWSKMQISRDLAGFNGVKTSARTATDGVHVPANDMYPELDPFDRMAIAPAGFAARF
jgi:hypothetical protein